MIKFTVYGVPVPQGSMVAFMPKGAKRPIITSANKKLKVWRNTVHVTALEAMGFLHPAGKNVAVRVEAIFFMLRAKSNKKIDATGYPDLDKLVRALLDGMTGVLFEDDSQVVEIHAFKMYGNPRVEVSVDEIVPPMARPLVGDRLKDDEYPF